MGYNFGECVICVYGENCKIQNVCKPCLKTSSLWSNSRFRHEIFNYETNVSGPAKDKCDYCKQPDTAVYQAALCKMHYNHYDLHGHIERHFGRQETLSKNLEETPQFEEIEDFIDSVKMLLGCSPMQIESSGGCICGDCHTTLDDLCKIVGYTYEDMTSTDGTSIKESMSEWLQEMGFTIDDFSNEKKFFFPERITTNSFWSRKCPSTIKSIVIIEYQQYNVKSEKYHDWDTFDSEDDSDDSDDLNDLDDESSENFWLSKCFLNKGEQKVVCHNKIKAATIFNIYNRLKTINIYKQTYNVNYAIFGDVLILYLNGYLTF